MTGIGVLGLGTMGAAMATNLVESGRDVVVWNRGAGPADALRDVGAIVAATAAEACAARVVMSMLATDEVFASVVLAEEALAAVDAGADLIGVNFVPGSPRQVDLRQAEAICAAIADSPVGTHDPATCIQDSRNCVMPLANHYDPLVAAGHLDPSVALIDVNDYLCPGGRCPAVIGNVVVWRDRHHITATFARTMAAPLAARLDAALSAAGAKTLAKTLAGPKTLVGRKTLESAAASPQKPDHVAPAF